MRVRRSLLALLLVLSIASTRSSATPQSPGTDPHVGHSLNPTKLALAVDGATSPQTVPDEMAYALFFRALASPSARRAERMGHVLTKAGLASADRDAVANALENFSQVMDVVAQQRKANPADPTFRSQEVEALQTARQAVAQSVSSAGQTLLDAYVQTHVKPRVKIYRGGGPKEVQ